MTSLNDVTSDNDLRDLALQYTRQYPAKRRFLNTEGNGIPLMPLDHAPQLGERVWLYATGRIRPAVFVKMGRKNARVYHSTPTTIANAIEYGSSDVRVDAVKTKTVPLSDLYQERV
jgi:hypothetical protein